MARGDKYAGLRRYLEQCPEDSVTMTFQEIEKQMGSELPLSAHKYSAFWANQKVKGHPYKSAWMDAGYETTDVHVTQGVLTFRKVR